MCFQTSSFLHFYIFITAYFIVLLCSIITADIYFINRRIIQEDRTLSKFIGTSNFIDGIQESLVVFF